MVNRPDDDLHDASARGDLAMVQSLVEQGVSMTQFDELDRTPLHHAVQNDQFAVVRYFLSKGVDVNIQNEAGAGETPLGVAISDCSYRMAKLLIEAGADPRLPGWMGMTAIDRAQDRHDKEAKAILVLVARAAGRLDRDAQD